MSLDKAKAHLKACGLDERIIILEDSSATVALAAKALGTEEAQIAKTMSFTVNDQTILILLAGDARIDNRKFKDAFHTKAKMVPFAEVEAKTGHMAGGVCPFGINGDVLTYLDESLKRFDIVYPACGTSHSAVRLNVNELETCAQNLKGWVNVSKLS